MQVSYNVAGANGQEVAAQFEARIRHDAQAADPATVQVLDGIARYVRDAVSHTSDPVAVEIDLTIRTKSQWAHLAPVADPTPSDEFYEKVPSRDEGDEEGLGAVIRALSIVSDEEVAETGEATAERVLAAMEAAENDALIVARAETAQ